MRSKPPKIKPFRFESYGARVEVTSSLQEVIDRAADVARTSMLGDICEITSGPYDPAFDLDLDSGTGMYRLVQNGTEIARGDDPDKFFKFFDSLLRVSIGEAARGHVFIHAGAVGWKGRAIILPGDSYKGKSTLVAALVKNGAEYYSDDFAVFDGEGRLHPFHRPFAMRTSDGKFNTYQLTVEDLGGKYGFDPIPAGLVLLTEYNKGSQWRPKRLTTGQGVLEMIRYALPIRHSSKFAFEVLNIIARRAIIISSRRGTAETFAKTLLNFVDKHVN
ncbi:MAG: hypothetical protein AB7J13_03530 [Pyrinomonadaceae bacterium]